MATPAHSISAPHRYRLALADLAKAASLQRCIVAALASAREL